MAIAVTLVVEAEVVTPSATLPPPGVVHGLQVDRYRVRRVLSGSYEHQVLFAAREAGTPFAVGDLVRLTLATALPDGATPLIGEPIEVTRYGLFYVVAFERLGTTARR